MISLIKRALFSSQTEPKDLEKVNQNQIEDSSDLKEDQQIELQLTQTRAFTSSPPSAKAHSPIPALSNNRIAKSIAEMDEPSTPRETPKEKRTKKKNRKLGGARSVLQMERNGVEQIDDVEDMDAPMSTPISSSRPALGRQKSAVWNTVDGEGWEKRKSKRNSVASQNDDSNNAENPDIPAEEEVELVPQTATDPDSPTKKEKKKKKKRSSNQILDLENNDATLSNGHDQREEVPEEGSIIPPLESNRKRKHRKSQRLSDTEIRDDLGLAEVDNLSGQDPASEGQSDPASVNANEDTTPVVKKKKKHNKAVVKDVNGDAQVLEDTEVVVSADSTGNGTKSSLAESNLQQSFLAEEDGTEQLVEDNGTERSEKKKKKKRKSKSLEVTSDIAVAEIDDGDASSAALLNQSLPTQEPLNPEANNDDLPEVSQSSRNTHSAEPHSPEDQTVQPSRLSAKARGKRPARRESTEQPSNKKKRVIDPDPRNRDIRSSWLQPRLSDVQRGESSGPLSLQAQKLFEDSFNRNKEGSANAGPNAGPSTSKSPVGSNKDTSSKLPSITSSSKGKEKAGDATVDGEVEDAILDDGETVVENPSEPIEPLVKKSKTPRKRRPPVDDPLQKSEPPKKRKKSEKASTKDESTTTPKPSKKKRTSTSKNSQQKASEEPKGHGGRFSSEDTSRISDAVELFRQCNDMTQEDVNDAIQNNAKSTRSKEAWDFICNEVPDLPKRNVQSWTRRAFHNFVARGTWTPEQDEELKEAFDRLPKKWAQIGAELNRLPDDCRDRWRNYLSVTNLSLGVWNEEEVKQLRDAVKHCIELIREERRKDGQLTHDEEDIYLEEDISWMRVSELMDSSRSHLQCYRKWNSIKAKEQATTDELVSERVVIKHSFEKLQSAQDAVKLQAREKLQLLKAARDSEATKEKDLNWTFVNEQLERNYDPKDLRFVLRALRHQVNGWESMPMQQAFESLIKAFETSAPYEPSGFDKLDLTLDPIEPPQRQVKKSKSKPRVGTNEPSASKPKTPKMKNRMLKEGESQKNTEVENADDGDLSDTLRMLSSVKKKKTERKKTEKKKTARLGRGKKIVSALSEELVVESDNDDAPNTPPSAQPPKDKTPRSNQSLKIYEDGEEEHLSDSQDEREANGSVIDGNDIEDEDQSPQRRSPGVSSRITGNISDDDKENKTPLDGRRFFDGEDEVMANADDEIIDDDEQEIPGTPEHDLERSISGRQASAELDESPGLLEVAETEDEVQVAESGHSDSDSDVSDIPARAVD